MIVRILGEGQYRLEDGAVERLNEFDNACVTAVSGGDETEFQGAFDSLLGLVRSEGEQLADDELEQSDVILPPADTSLEEAAADFTGDGLIPD